PPMLIDAQCSFSVEAEPSNVDEVSGAVAGGELAEVDRSWRTTRGQLRSGERVFRNGRVAGNVVTRAGWNDRQWYLRMGQPGGDFADRPVATDDDHPVEVPGRRDRATCHIRGVARVRCGDDLPRAQIRDRFPQALPDGQRRTPAGEWIHNRE